VYTWECGDNIPDLEMLERICYALKVPADFFDAVYKAERFKPRTPRERKKKT
jgi:transcriptional regulator with XRE-family HTH domain